MSTYNTDNSTEAESLAQVIPRKGSGVVPVTVAWARLSFFGVRPMFGLGTGTLKLLAGMIDGVALTRAQCDAICRNGIITLERFGYVKYCKNCERYAIVRERLDAIAKGDSE